MSVPDIKAGSGWSHFAALVAAEISLFFLKIITVFPSGQRDGSLPCGLLRNEPHIHKKKNYARKSNVSFYSEKENM